MREAHWHIYQVLTKRHERICELLNGELSWMSELRHVWYGVSVEDRTHGLPRIDVLRNTPARVRFLSIEPLLEDLGEVNLQGLDWVIVGGESGPRARVMDGEWALSILRQCQEQGVAFFFKQWGGRSRKAGGRLLKGREWSQFPAALSGFPQHNSEVACSDCLSGLPISQRNNVRKA